MQKSEIGTFVPYNDDDWTQAHYETATEEFLICSTFVEKVLGNKPKKIDVTISDERLTGDNVFPLDLCRGTWGPAWRFSGTEEAFDSNISDYAYDVLDAMMGAREKMKVWLQITPIE